MFFIIEKSKETTFNILQNFVSIRKNGYTKTINLFNNSSNGESKFATENGML